MNPPPTPSQNDAYDVVFYTPFVGKILAARKGVIPTGGAETQIYLLARGLASRGLSVGVIVYEVPGGLPESFDGVDVIVRKPYRGALGGNPSLLRRAIGSAMEAATVVLTVIRVNSEVVVQRTAGLETALVALACRLARRRFVWSSASNSDFTPKAVSRRAWQANALAKAVPTASSVIVQTEEQVQLCEETFRRTPVRIPSLAEPAGQAAVDRGPFLWIGRTVDYKCPLEFLELAAAAPDLAFQMVAVPTENADRDLIAEVQARGATLANVEMLEARPRAELMELVESATAVVSTSIWEGMPNIFLEGWARGVPALSLHFDPDGLISERHLGVFARGSAKSFIEGARLLSSDRELRIELAANCRRYVKKEHSPEVVAGRWLEALELSGGMKGDR